MDVGAVKNVSTWGCVVGWYAQEVLDDWRSGQTSLQSKTVCGDAGEKDSRGTARQDGEKDVVPTTAPED